jgi:hypothetical protein
MKIFFKKGVDKNVIIRYNRLRFVGFNSYQAV